MLKQLIARTVVALALTSCAPAVQAQANPDSVHHRNDCRLAAQVLTHGQPTNKRTWAGSYILRCGAAGGAAIAEVIRTRRDEATRQPDFDHIILLTSRIRDRAIFEAAAAIARDPAAGKVSRIQAIRTLYFQISAPGNVDPYESFLTGPAADMTYVPQSHANWIVGTQLAPDAVRQALEIAESVAASATDRDLRTAAAKLARAARTALGGVGP